MTQIKITFKGARFSPFEFVKAYKLAKRLEKEPTCKGIMFGDNINGFRFVEIRRV